MSDYLRNEVVVEMEEEEAKAMSDSLPNEVVVEILLRLPVKSLVRCRCVCKKWCSVISSNTFITTHINQAVSRSIDDNKSSLRLFRSMTTLCLRELACRHYEHLSLRSDDESFGNNNNFIKLGCPLSCGSVFGNYSDIVGLCKGVLCRAYNDPYYTDGYILWNPSIHKALRLPEPNIARGMARRFDLKHSHGFGYDPSSNDIKLVRLVYRKRAYNKAPPLVEIYTLNTGCWRAIASPAQSYIVKERCLSVFVNGASHWLAHTPPDEDTSRNVIVAFDMCDEFFHEIPVPNSFVGKSYLNMTVGVRDGLLCLVPHNYKEEEEQCFSVWIMKQYGIGESWTKLFNIDISQGLQRVVAFRKNGEVLVTDGNGELHSYEPDMQQVTNLGFHGFSSASRVQKYEGGWFFLDTYSESLVLLKVQN